MKDTTEKKTWLAAIPKATAVIIAINIIYFLVIFVCGGLRNTVFGTQILLKLGALYVPGVKYGHEYYRIVTSMFMHLSARHIFGNMILFAFIGDILEAQFGSVRLLAAYLVTGIIGNIATVFIYGIFSPNTISAGASGAVFGLVGVVAWLVVSHKGRYGGISIIRLVMMIVFSLYIGLIGHGTNNVAHIFGLVSGFVIGMLLFRTKDGKDEYGNGRRGGGRTGGGPGGYSGTTTNRHGNNSDVFDNDYDYSRRTYR